MRLLFLERSPRFVGGSERLSLDLCRHACARGNQAVLVHAEEGNMVAAYEAVGARAYRSPVVPIAVRQPLAALRAFVALRQIARAERIDVLVSSHVSYASLMAAVARATGARTALHLGVVYDFPSPLFRAGSRAINLAVAPSEHTARQWAERGWPTAALRVIPNGVDVDTFAPGDGREPARVQLGLPSVGLVVSYVGRLVREKGIFTLLRAFADYRRQGGSALLLLVGHAPGSEASELRAMAAAEGLADAAWQVRPPTSEPQLVYRASDLVVVPSEWDEPFGLVPLEAMACGALTIVSDSGILPSLVAPLGGAAVFGARDVQSLAERFMFWLRDRDDAERDRAAAAQAHHVRDRFSFSRCGDAYLAAFQSLLQTRHAAFV